MAEGMGFEPTIPCGIHAFQACSFGHSDTLPVENITQDVLFYGLNIFLCGQGFCKTQLLTS